MKLKYLYIVVLLCMLVYTSCDDGYKHYDGIYMGSTLGNNPMISVVVDDVFPKTVELNVASTKVVDNDVIIELDTDPMAITAYNEKYGTMYEALPATCFEFPLKEAVIRKGNYANSDPIEFKITSSNGMVEGTRYMIPVTIRSIKGGSIIEASRTLYIALNQIIVGPALRLVGSQYTTTNFSQPGPGVTLPYDVSALTKVTMEARIFMESQDGSKLNSIFGLEENFVVRRTAEGGKTGQLELAGGGISNVLTSEQFPFNSWKHVAIVYDGDASGKGKATIYIDGQVSNSMDVQRKGDHRILINLHAQYMQASDHGEGGGAKWVNTAPFWIGKSERARYLHGSVSEAKIWAKALTASEVNANMCVTDPNADMLIAYWRFNDGGADGKTFKDLTGHGFDMKLSSGTASWTQNVRCPENY